MKKWYLILTSLYFFNTSHAMELIKKYNETDTLIEIDLLEKKKNKIKKDWPFLSIPDATKELQTIPQKGIQKIYKKTSRSLSGMLHALPIEVTEKIICTMLDYDEQATEKFMGMPVINAFTQYQKAKKTLTLYPQMKNKSVALFFRTPTEQQQRIVSIMSSRKIMQLISGETTIITKDERHEIEQLDPEIKDEFIKGQPIAIGNKNLPLGWQIPICAFGISIGVPTTLLIVGPHNAPSIIISTLGGITLAGISLCMALDIRNKYRSTIQHTKL